MYLSSNINIICLYIYIYILQAHAGSEHHHVLAHVPCHSQARTINALLPFHANQTHQFLEDYYKENALMIEKSR